MAPYIKFLWGIQATTLNTVSFSFSHSVSCLICAADVNSLFVWIFPLTLPKSPSELRVCHLYWRVQVFRFLCCLNGSECNYMTLLIYTHCNMTLHTREMWVRFLNIVVYLSWTACAAPLLLVLSLALHEWFQFLFQSSCTLHLSNRNSPFLLKTDLLCVLRQIYKDLCELWVYWFVLRWKTVKVFNICKFLCDIGHVNPLCYLMAIAVQKCNDPN